MRFRREFEIARPERMAGVAGTVLVHGALAAVVLISALRTPPPSPTIYSVELIAAPPATAQRSSPTPVPAPPPPPKVDPKPAPKSVPVKKPPTKVDPKTEPTTPAKTTEVPNPGVTPKDGNAVENVNVVGKAFPFPEYLNRVVNEIMRRWARPAGTQALEAEVSFTIMRDGSVRDIRVIRGSRSYAFNLEAQGAVEQAGEEKAFGPLPRGWDSDILQIAFLFTPRKNP
jgi:outer membrane biosynthesis protein TonB